MAHGSGTMAPLPWEMWYHIFSFMDLSQLCICQLACKAWRGRCQGHWDRFLPRTVPYSLIQPYLTPLRHEAQATLCFRGHLRYNTALPRCAGAWTWCGTPK